MKIPTQFDLIRDVTLADRVALLEQEAAQAGDQATVRDCRLTLAWIRRGWPSGTALPRYVKAVNSALRGGSSE